MSALLDACMMRPSARIYGNLCGLLIVMLLVGGAGSVNHLVCYPDGGYQRVHAGIKATIEQAE